VHCSFMPSTEVSAALQLAVSPVILISAVGLLLLVLNNRLGLSINRARALVAERARVSTEDMGTHIDQ
jgi:hypothetical protein